MKTLKTLTLTLALLVGSALADLAYGQTFQIPQPNGAMTCGSGTGVTCTDYGGMLKVTVTRLNCVANAQTCDVTLATAAAKTKIYSVVADITQAYTCSATCTTSTLSATTGKTAGGNEYLLSFDIDAAVARFGLTAAQTGASLAASSAQGGDVPSWTGTTAINARITSGTGNLGNGSVTNLGAGSITFYIEYTLFP